MRLRESMPPLEGATFILNGHVTREELIGEKPTLIHFWAVSCHLCKQEMPSINELRDRYKDMLNVVSIHMPRKQEDLDIDTIEVVGMEHDITQVTIIDSQYTLANLFENKLVPTYYVFDKEGKLRHLQVGGSGSMAMLEKRVTRVVQEAQGNI
jgi:thiol-disulfide isomerase/thioredoxin